MTPYSCRRNSIDDARAFYRVKGYVTDDEVRVLLKLQDDSSDLRALIAAEGWDIRKPDIRKAF